MYASKYASNIERNAKCWRVYSIAITSFGMLLEACSLIFPHHFLLIASVANIFKMIGISAALISRTSILESVCKNNNMVEVSNKFNLQSNISLLVGNLIGFCLSLIVPIKVFVPTFSLLCALALFYNYSAVRSLSYISFNTFNFDRLTIFFEEYINTKKILSPEEVASMEKLYYHKYKNINFCNKSADLLLKHENNNFQISLFDIFKDKNYFITVNKKFSITKLKNVFYINNFLKVNADNNDIFLSFLASFRLYNQILERINTGKAPTYNDLIPMIENNVQFIEEIDKKVLFEKMKTLNWNMNFSNLEEKYSRFHMMIKNS